MSYSKLLDSGYEAVGHLLEQGRGKHGMAAVLVQEPPEVLGSLKQRHVAVEVQAIDAVDLDVTWSRNRLSTFGMALAS